MTMRNIAFLILLTGLVSLPLQAQEVLTLEKSIKIALTRNTSVQKSLNDITSKESSLMTAYGNLLPSVNVSAGWNWTRSEDQGGSVNIGGALINLPPSTNESRTYSAAVNSNLVLFDGLANYAQVEAGKQGVESAKLALQRVKEDIIFQAISGYYNILNLQELVKVREEDLKWNKKNLETIEARNSLGSVTLADVYSQQVKTGNAELELLKAQNLLETSKSEYLSYLGLDVLKEFIFEDVSVMNQVRDTTDESYITDKNLTELVSNALNSRADYRSAKLGVESAYKGADAARGAYYPTLSNFMSFGLRAPEIGQLFDTKTYNIGLQLNYPLFQGWQISNRVQQAEISAKNYELQVSDLEREIKRNIQKTYLDILTADKQSDVARKNVLSATENRRIESEKYSLGSTTLLSVMIANSEYLNAQTNFINSQFELMRLRSRLEYYIGVLDSKQYE